MKQKKFKETKSQNAGLHLIAILLIAITMISSSFGLYAWAKYTSTQSGNATAQIAKWYFNLQTGEYTQNGPVLLELTRTDNKQHVVEGKLAPGTSGVLPIIIDTTGTETDLTYDITVVINNCPQNMVFTTQTEQGSTQEVTGDGVNSPRVRTIRIQKYIPNSTTDANRKHDETIAWNWPYETPAVSGGNTVAQNDQADTLDNGKTVSVTITAVGTEVQENPYSSSSSSNAITANILNTTTSQYEEVTLTKENVNNYIGKQVEYSNSNLEWSLFYVDFDNKYKDGNGAIYLKANYPNSLIAQQLSQTYDASKTRFEDMNPTWKSSEMYSDGINYENEKASAYLCDPTKWTQFYTGNSSAGYAMGAPSLDMYMDSLAQLSDSNYPPISFEYSQWGCWFIAEDNYFQSSAENSVPQNKVYSSQNKADVEWWVASPNGCDQEEVCTVSCNYFCIDYENGLYESCKICPIVCLKP